MAAERGKSWELVPLKSVVSVLAYFHPHMRTLALLVAKALSMCRIVVWAQKIPAVLPISSAVAFAGDNP